MDAVNKAAPVLASSKVDGSAAPKPTSASLDDIEMKKVLEDCKRLQMEMNKLQDENRQLKVTSGGGVKFQPLKDHWNSQQYEI